MSRFVAPPRLRTIDAAPGRNVTWLELFFDLVFVVAVAQLAEGLAEQHDGRGLFEFLVLFVPVWWAWAGFAYYANRFDTDDVVYRVLSLTGMFAVAALATNVHHAFSGGARGFALAYVSVRLVILILYARDSPRGRSSSACHLVLQRLFARGHHLGRLAGCGVADTVAALGARAFDRDLGSARRLASASARAHPPDAHPGALRVAHDHRPGRVRVRRRRRCRRRALETESVLAALGGFVIAATLWWIYFEFVDSEAVVRTLLGGLTYTYAHFPLVAGVAALGVGVKLAIPAAAGKSEYAGTGWILCAGLALAMVALAVLQLVTPPTLFGTDVWLRVATGVVALALVPAAGVLSPVLLVWIIALLLAAQLMFELFRHEEHSSMAARLETKAVRE